MNTTRARAILLSVMGMVTVAMLGAGPAQAAEGDLSTCWHDLDTGKTQCFEGYAAFESAVAEQTGGLLLQAGEVVKTGHSAAAVNPRATYVLATLYDGMNYSGTSINITTSYSSMCTQYYYNGDTMPSGWDNRVSSWISYGTCKTRVSENQYQGGAHYGPVAKAASIGLLNNQGSSYWITG